MAEHPVNRRAVLIGGAGLLTSFAGCISTSATPPGRATQSSDDSGGGGSTNILLKLGGSSTVYPIVNTAASYWGANSPASDEEYWGPKQYGIDTEKPLAEYWGGLYGFEPPDGGGPPFDVSVNLSHSGTGLEKLRSGQLDIGDASAPVEDELSEASEEELKKFKNHVVGVDAQPLVVSQAIYEGGVKQLRADQVRKIYRGEIEKWSEIEQYSGPDKDIQVIGRSVGSGTDTSFRTNMLGGPNAKMPGVDVRKGENQQVKTIISKADNAIGYLALAFVDDSISAIALDFDGKVYEPGKNLAESGYPLSRDLHCYTYEDTSKKEAAFLRMVLSDYGQEQFVKSAGYATLPKKRQQSELDKLPEPEK